MHEIMGHEGVKNLIVEESVNSSLKKRMCNYCVRFGPSIFVLGDL